MEPCVLRIEINRAQLRVLLVFFFLCAHVGDLESGGISGTTAYPPGGVFNTLIVKAQADFKGPANLTGPTKILRTGAPLPNPGDVLTAMDPTGMTHWQPPSGGLPSGVIVFFDTPACPAGYTEVIQARGRYLVGTQPGVVPRSVFGTAPLSVAEQTSFGRKIMMLHAHNDMGTGGTGNVGQPIQWMPAVHMAWAEEPQMHDTFELGMTIAAPLPTSNETDAPGVSLTVCRKD